MILNTKYYKIWTTPNTSPEPYLPIEPEYIIPEYSPTIEPYLPTTPTTPTTPITPSITPIILNSFYSFNNLTVKLELINGKVIKGKIVNQTAWLSNLVEIITVYKNKEKTKFIQVDKIISVELINK